MVETAALDWSVIHRPVLEGPHSHGDLDLFKRLVHAKSLHARLVTKLCIHHLS